MKPYCGGTGFDKKIKIIGKSSERHRGVAPLKEKVKICGKFEAPTRQMAMCVTVIHMKGFGPSMESLLLK